MIPKTFLSSIIPTGAATLSDIMFMAKKVFDSKERSAEGTLDDATGDLATLTANTGKDMYLAGATINARVTGTAAGVGVVELKINGITVETYSCNLTNGSGPDSGNSSDNYPFKIKGVKVATGQVIKLEVISSTDIEFNGVIQCWEENTGATPTI